MDGHALVTGSGGFVGRHVTAALIRDGWQVHGVDIKTPTGTPTKVHCQDMRTWLNSTGLYIQPELVVHCAAVVGGRTMIDGAPLQLAAEDLSLDAELFRWLLSRKTPPKVVYYSSSAAYPIGLQDESTRRAQARRAAEGLPQWGLDEAAIDVDLSVDADDPSPWSYLPDATYGWVKLTGERLAREANAMGIPVYVFRPFSGYGSDQDLTYPFPSFIERARRRDDPFTVWGDGRQVRDFIHIDDVVDATLARVQGDDTSPVNLCTGIGTSFLALAADTMMLAGYDGSVLCEDDKPVGVRYRVGDPTKMHTFYRPKVTLDTGIRRALDG